jgi:hypothetical protein
MYEFQALVPDRFPDGRSPTVNGCSLKPGDLLGSGTESSPTPEEAGSQLELTVGGKQPVPLPNGETRSFLEDGDTVILRAWCEKPGFVRIGFAECRSTVVPAVRSALLIDGAGETTGADGWGWIRCGEDGERHRTPSSDHIQRVRMM